MSTWTCVKLCELFLSVKPKFMILGVYASSTGKYNAARQHSA